MAVNVYEGMFILDSAAYGRNPDEVSGQINSILEKAGAEVLVTRLWVDSRRLAYPINRQKKGTYWLTYFKVDGLQLTDLTRQTQLNNSVLRHLFLKVDPKLIDTLVEHALAGPERLEESSEAAKAPAPATVAAIDKVDAPDAIADVTEVASEDASDKNASDEK